MRRDYDCLIVGAGMAGAALALALGGIGLRTAVLDSRVPARGRAAADPRALVLAPSSQRILHALAIWDRLSPRIVAIERIHVSDRGCFGFTHLHRRDVGLPALGYVCPADHLSACLEDALERLAGCDLYWSVAVSRIDAGADGAMVAIRGGGGERSLRARLVVGADGVRSVVRRHAGIGVDVHDYGQSAIVANLTTTGRCPATAFERFTRDGPIALLPLSERRWVSVRVVPHAQLERIAALSARDYLADLALRFGRRLGACSNLGERHSYPLALSRARALVAERCALVGGAANSVHPNAAQGLNLGLRDVAALAECIADAARGGRDIGARDGLERYAARRRLDQGRVVVFTDLLARAFTSRLAPVALARDAAMIAIDLIPLLKRRLILSAMGLTGPLPRLVTDGVL